MIVPYGKLSVIVILEYFLRLYAIQIHDFAS